ncbi:unnamed protein product [Ilex paraguariensis]|uniref:SBP-type domain-containing protein n=1 Tax=Ilex paraguariensis TaxID=185542 RepID=A0ABC8SQB6_9AQUA
MDNGWNLLNNSTNGVRGQNGNSTNLAWDIWGLGTPRFGWTNSHSSLNLDNTTSVTAAAPPVSANSTTLPDESAVHALMFSDQVNNANLSSSCSLYAGGSQYPPDPHLTCLELGKRHYFEDATPLDDRHVAAGFSSSKRSKPYCSGGGLVGPSTSAAVTVAAPPPAVPRCQVEGCHVALLNAKDYHRRHKVCEMHSKAPKVVVLGLEQRFCQQCSRFHAVSEFDDAKRSCRRRLAGHNERRRKSSHDHSGPRSSNQDHKLMAGRYPYLSTPTGRALSLLSTRNDDSWTTSADLSSRCSAALHELIAEHRAAIFTRDLHWHNHPMEDINGPKNGSTSVMPNQHHMFPETINWDRFSEGEGHVTLDLMQAPSSTFGFLSMKRKSFPDCGAPTLGELM